ncbi:MAG TPA: hypothetical protein VKG92_07230 [Flavobacteriales bacterium]|nr:hypothetical protein [Flavobacteriales bacterium]
MRHLATTTLLLTSITATLAQTDVKVDPRFDRFLQKAYGSDATTYTPPATANLFYATYDDFVNGKPVPDMVLNSIGGSSLTYTKGGKQSKTPIKELTASYWGYCDRYGLLQRIWGKDSYQVMIAGNVTQYVRRDEASGTLKADSTFALIYGGPQGGGYLDYGSKGVNGEIVDLDVSYKGHSKALEEFMADHPEILEALKADGDKTKYVGGEKYRDRENLTFKIQHYIREYNKL